MILSPRLRNVTIVMLILWMALPCAEMIVGQSAPAAASCEGILSFRIWLTVKGATGLPMLMLWTVLLVVLRDNNMDAVRKYRFFFLVEATFRIVWLVMGATILWGNCHLHPLVPAPVESMMWASLLLGFLSALCASMRVIDMFSTPTPTAAVDVIV